MSMSAAPMDFYGGMSNAINASPKNMYNPNAGMGVGMDYRNLTNPVADQTQQMANNPIYGQESPFQPPRQQPGMPAVIGGDDPMGMNMGFGKGMGMMPGQMVGGPAGRPIFRGFPMEPYQPNPLQGTPMQQMPLPMMQPGGSVGQQQMPQPMMPPSGSVGQQPRFTGGLRPAPRNYRAPVRRMR